MESTEELKALKQENSKLKLEARLRKSLASELERQKSLVQEAKIEADGQRDKLQKASEQLSKYLSPQICEKIFSGAEFSNKSARKKRANNLQLGESTRTCFWNTSSPLQFIL